MASYRLLIKPSAVKELEAVARRDRRRLVSRIRSLEHDARPHGCEKLSGQQRYRLRQGAYRVVYSIDDDEMTVTIVKIAHRREAYR